VFKSSHVPLKSSHFPSNPAVHILLYSDAKVKFVCSHANVALSRRVSDCQLFVLLLQQTRRVFFLKILLLEIPMELCTESYRYSKYMHHNILWRWNSKTLWNRLCESFRLFLGIPITWFCDRCCLVL